MLISIFEKCMSMLVGRVLLGSHGCTNTPPIGGVALYLLVKFFMGRSPVLVVMGGDSRSEGRGFESQCCILDGHYFTLICCKIVLMFV